MSIDEQPRSDIDAKDAPGGREPSDPGRQSSRPPEDDAIVVADDLLANDHEIDLDGRASTSEERKRGRKIVAWLRGIIPRLGEDDAAQVFVEVSEQMGSLGSASEALEAAREGFRRDPQHVAVARAYRLAAMRAGAEREICTALEGEARGEVSSVARSVLETERGSRLERLHDGDKAARFAYLRALEGPGANVLALASLERLAARDQSPLVAATYAKKLAEATHDEGLRAEHLARAARHLEEAGEHAEASQLAAGALVEEPRSALVGFTVERLAAVTGSFEELVELRQRQIDDGAIEAAEGWFDIGVMARYRLGDAGGATAAFERAAAASETRADRRACCGELLSLYEATGRWEDVVGCARELCEDAPPERRAALLTRIGATLFDCLGDDREALIAFEAALEVLPGYVGALEGAGRIHHRRGDTSSLIAMHRRQAEAAEDPRDRAAALRRAGEHLVERESTRGDGIELLREALAIVPGDSAAFDALERALEADGAWGDLAGLYDDALERGHLDPSRRGFILARVAQIAAEHLDDPRRALLALRALREAPGGHPSAPLVAAAARLEAMGDLEGLAEALARIAEQTASPAIEASTLARLAEIREERGQLDEAATILRRAVAVAPPGHAVLARAGRVFLRLERYDDLMRLLEEGSRQGSDSERARWLAKMAAVLDRHLQRPDQAIEALERARALDPRSTSIATALESILTREQRWQGLAHLVDGPALRRAVLAEAIGTRASAVAAYRQAFDEGVRVARLPYLRALLAEERWDERLRQELATVGNPDRVAASRCRAAICASRLGDRSSAARHLVTAAELAPATVAPLVGMLLLADCLEGVEVARLAALEQLTTDPSTQLAIVRLRAASLEGRGLFAAEVHEAVLERHPADPVALAAVTLALEASGARVELAARLRAALGDEGLDPGLRSTLAGRLGEVLEQLGQLREALDVLEIAGFGPPVRRTAWLGRHRIARALEDDVLARRAREALASMPPDGPERAVCLRLLAEDAPREDTLAEALRAHPRDYEALRELRRRMRHGDAEAYTEALTRAFEVEEDEAIVAPLGNALAAQLLREGRVDRARNVCERVLAIAPDSLSAWMLSAELYERRYAFTQALDALQRIVAHPAAEERLVLEALRRVAIIAIRRLHDAATARGALARIDQLAHDKIGLGVRLDVELALDDRVAAAATLAQMATRTDCDEDERARYLLRLASIKDGLGQAVAAMKALGRIRSPRQRAEVVERLFALGVRSGDWRSACDAIGQALEERSDDLGWESAMRARLARILREKLDCEDEAIAQEERIAELGASDLASLERLAAAVSDRDPNRAIEYHRQILTRQPDHTASYRAIRGLATAVGDEALAFFSEAVLEGLGLATEEESYFYKQRRSRFTATVPRLDLETLASLYPEGRGQAARLLATIDEELAGVVHVDPRSYGADDQGLPESLVTAAASMASLLGVERYRLLVGPSRITPAVEPGHVPLLLLPRSLGEALGGEQRFVCAALLARLAFRGAAADPGRMDALSEHHLNALIEAARRIGRTEAAELDPVGRDLHRRLEAVLSVSARARLAAVASDMVARVDGEGLRQGLLAASGRAALIGAGDPALAIRCFRTYRAMFGEPDAGLPAAAFSALPLAVSGLLAELRARFGEVRP